MPVQDSSRDAGEPPLPSLQFAMGSAASAASLDEPAPGSRACTTRDAVRLRPVRRTASQASSRAPQPDPASVGSAAAGDPGRAGAAPRRDRDGRQRAVGQGARAAAHQGPRAGRALALRRRRGRDRDRREGDLRLRVLDRELVPQPRRGQVPHGLQPRRDPAPPRRDARARRAGALGRPGAAAVEVGDQGAAGRRGDDEGQRRPHADDVRELRRPVRARRRRPARWRRTSRPAGSTPTRSTTPPSAATSTCPSCPTQT